MLRKKKLLRGRMSKFVHLHTHTEYSVLDGLARIPDLVDKAKRDGQQALAITDHGRMSGVPEFYQACRKADVRPIVGQEFYLCDDCSDRTRTIDPETGKKEGPRRHHLVLLARDRRGYEILCELSSTANDPSHFYYKPRIDYGTLEALSRKDRRHLIASSTCLNGPIPQLILANKNGSALELAQYFRELFPYFYLELQRHDYNQKKQGDRRANADQEKVNDKLIRWSERYGFPLVITNDSHYVEPAHHSVHDIWLACQTVSLWRDATRFRFDGSGYHLKTTREMRTLWADRPEVWAASQRTIQAYTADIQLSIPELEQRSWHIPVAPRANTEISSADYMRQICVKRLRVLERRGGLASSPDVYRDRLDYELGVITGSKFEEEFLIVRDYINWARDHNIRVGPGRGSMAGVLAAYLMGIVDVDPVRFGLMFERALNPARPSLPDFDVDFPNSRRMDVVRYLLDRYNKPPYQAQQVGTFSRGGPRSTVQRLLSALDFTRSEQFSASKSLPDAALIVNLKASGDLKDLLQDEHLHPVLKGAMVSYPAFYDWATTCQDLITGEGKHAAGIVIADEHFDLQKLVPTMMVGRGQGRGQAAVVTQYDMEGLKRLGVVKFDILSLTTLDVIQDCIELIGEDPFEDMYEYEDEAVWATLNRGACSGVFQVEGGTSRQVVRDLQLQSFEDLIAVMALGRGGANQFVSAYREGRDGGTADLRRKLPDRRLRRILPQGVVLYQEQVMEIGLQIGGFDHHLVDELKEAIKYKKGDIWDELKPLFFNGGELYDKLSGKSKGAALGALNNGCSQQVADQIWEMIWSYRGYGFNRAHATAYAMIAYQTAWLKTHYPANFFCTLLSYANKDDYPVYIDEAKLFFGLRFLPPDVNKSGSGFVVEGKHGIRYGLTAIKGLGIAACTELVENRPFTSEEHLVKTVTKRRCNVRIIDLLRRVGAMESIGTQGDEDRGKTELELLGTYVTTHPIDQYRAALDKKIRRQLNLKALTSSQDKWVWVGGQVDRVREITTKNGYKMAFVQVKYEGLGSWDVVVFPERWEQHGPHLFKGRVVMVYGKRQNDRNSIVFEEAKYPVPA
jgi:DNA polymerase III subunit alpha